jgi:hypothetical protein
MTRRIGPSYLSSRSLTAISMASATLAAILLLATPGTGFAAASGPAAGSTIQPVGELDCNGYSPVQRPVKPGGTLCAEVHGAPGGQLEDNGWYIGHDEPTMQFYSQRPGSSTAVTWVQTLPRDPRKLPTVNGPGQDITHFFELMPALWYSMALCDPKSYPQLPCTPDSDTNSPSATSPGGGSAFLELQFYPPGFPPFSNGLSCDGNHWCAALTIDSLECSNGFTSCNSDCVEPINFAFVQRDGIPTGPASPQLANLSTVTPNQETLLMNPGDKLVIQIFDNWKAGALETVIRDLSSGRTGFMLASAQNGFMNTSIATCDGTPWSFRPLYSTASTVNQGGWAAANINVAYEIGHFTPCTALDASGNFCEGPYEAAGPPDTSTEGNDAPCFPATATGLIAGCTGGDLDYDGTSYWPDWPDSLKPGMFPSPLTIEPPTTVYGADYSQMQFLTDNPATNSLCDPSQPVDCVVPPPQAPGQFYPYYTQARVKGDCVWEFGQMTNGNTFGGDEQYGSFTTALGLAEDASPIMRNRRC